MTIAPSYWDESYPPSLWGGGGPQPQTQVAPGDVVPDTDITSLPPAEWLAAINDAYVGNPLTAWTTGQSATIATLVVHWAGGAWLADPAAVRKAPAKPEPEPEPERDGDPGQQEADPPSDPEPDPEPATTPTKAKKTR